MVFSQVVTLVGVFVASWFLGVLVRCLVELTYDYRVQKKTWGDGCDPSGKPWRLAFRLSNGRRLYTGGRGICFTISFKSVDGWGKEL